MKAAFEVQQERDVAQVNYEVLHERDQQWQKDFADLVQKYNALVERCASIPNPPKPLVCTTTNLGHGDSTMADSEGMSVFTLQSERLGHPQQHLPEPRPVLQ